MRRTAAFGLNKFKVAAVGGKLKRFWAKCKKQGSTQIQQPTFKAEILFHEKLLSFICHSLRETITGKN